MKILIIIYFKTFEFSTSTYFETTLYCFLVSRDSHHIKIQLKFFRKKMNIVKNKYKYFYIFN